MLRKLTSSFLSASTLKKTNNSTMVYGMMFQAMQRFNSTNYAEEQQQEQSFEKRQFKPRTKRFIIKPEDYKSAVYIGNLDYATEWQELKAHVETAGAVKFATVGRDAEGRSKGYGIIVFASEQDAQNAIATMNNSELRGRKIKAGEFQPRERTDADPQQQQQYQPQRAAREFGSRLNTRVPRDVKTVYVGNLADKVSQEDVQSVFSSVGNIENIAFKVSKNGHFALVTFATKEEAAKAVQELNEKEVNGQVIVVREDKKF